MDILDYTGVWSCTSGPAAPSPGRIVSGGFMEPDWDAWHREIARRQQAILDDEEDFIFGVLRP